MRDDYLRVSNLNFTYGEEPVLADVSYSIRPGEFVTLTGENGAAKSTLIKASLGLLKPKSGEVYLADKNQQGEKMAVGYIPQEVASFNAGFPSTVIELVRSGRYQRNRWFKRFTMEDHAHVEKALKSVGMWDMRHRRVGELSGGQKQRICLARMFATDPDLFVLDEPTTGMDESSRNQFYELLKHSAHDHGKAILMVTHDHEDIKKYADRNIHLVRKENTEWRCFHMTS